MALGSLSPVRGIDTVIGLLRTEITHSLTPYLYCTSPYTVHAMFSAKLLVISQRYVVDLKQRIENQV